MQAVKAGIHRVLNRFGIEVRLVKNIRAAGRRDGQEEERQRWRFLRHYDISTILDIGANEGQFATVMRELRPDASIYSFEPLPDVFEILEKNFSGDPSHVAVNIGLSDEAGLRAMHRSDFSPSSSLLAMASLHKDEWPQSAGQTEVEVKLATLDGWSARLAGSELAGLMVKMDVQGHELAVINGGLKTLRAARLVVVEVSFHELYEGQPLFAEIHDSLADLGFRYRGSLEQHYSTKMDRFLFADAIFENMSNAG